MTSLMARNVPAICVDGEIRFVSRTPPRDRLIAALATIASYGVALVQTPAVAMARYVLSATNMNPTWSPFCVRFASDLTPRNEKRTRVGLTQVLVSQKSAGNRT